MHEIHTQNDTLECITVEYSTLHRNTVQYSTVKYSRAIQSLRSILILFSLVWNVQE